MRLISLTLCRNEDWVLGATLRAALEWNDHAVVLLHACTDRSAEIVAEISAENPGRVTVLVEPNPVWLEMTYRQRMLDAGRALGGTHFSNIDSDELLTANLLAPGVETGRPVIREHIESLPPGKFLQVTMPCMWRSLTRWRNDNSNFGLSMTMLAFADSPELTWKPRADGYQFHNRTPHGAKQGRRLARDCGGLMHLQFAPWARLVAKHKNYRVSERLMYPWKPVADIERLYSLATDERGAKIEDAPTEWVDAYAELFKLVDLEAEPWQEAAVARAIAEHGIEHFAGLNLGLVEQREVAA